LTVAAAGPLVVGLTAGRLVAALAGLAGVEEAGLVGRVGVAAAVVRGVGVGFGAAESLVGAAVLGAAVVTGTLLAAVADVAREADVVVDVVVVVFLIGAVAGLGAEAGRAVAVLGAGVGLVAAGEAAVEAGVAFLSGDSLVGRAGLAAASAGALGSAAGLRAAGSAFLTGSLVAGFAAGAELGLVDVGVFFAVEAGRGFLATGDFALEAAAVVAAAAATTAATTGTVEPASEPIVAAVDTGLSS